MFAALLAMCGPCGVTFASPTDVTAVHRTKAADFLTEINVDMSAHAALLNGMRNRPNGELISTARSGGAAYALVFRPLLRTLPRSSEGMTLSVAIAKAQNALAIALSGGRVDRLRYPFDDALGTALLSRYTEAFSTRISGIQTAGDIITGTGGERWAAALAWVTPDVLNSLDKVKIDEAALTDEYCRFLYRELAEKEFRAGRYDEALPMFRNIHDLHWADVNAYLDASECFLRTGAEDDCSKLLRELKDALGDKMSSANFERAGELFMECRADDDAAESFRMARMRYREER